MYKYICTYLDAERFKELRALFGSQVDELRLYLQRKNKKQAQRVSFSVGAV